MPDIFVVRSSTKECTHHPTPKKAKMIYNYVWQSKIDLSIVSNATYIRIKHTTYVFGNPVTMLQFSSFAQPLRE
jgi:hypothetical protein